MKEKIINWMKTHEKELKLVATTAAFTALITYDLCKGERLDSVLELHLSDRKDGKRNPFDSEYFKSGSTGYTVKDLGKLGRELRKNISSCDWNTKVNFIKYEYNKY